MKTAVRQSAARPVTKSLKDVLCVVSVAQVFVIVAVEVQNTTILLSLGVQLIGEASVQPQTIAQSSSKCVSMCNKIESV